MTAPLRGELEPPMRQPSQGAARGGRRTRLTPLCLPERGSPVLVRVRGFGMPRSGDLALRVACPVRWGDAGPLRIPVAAKKIGGERCP
jgi:hypothetical protein